MKIFNLTTSRQIKRYPSISWQQYSKHEVHICYPFFNPPSWQNDLYTPLPFLPSPFTTLSRFCILTPHHTYIPTQRNLNPRISPLFCIKPKTFFSISFLLFFSTVPEKKIRRQHQSVSLLKHFLCLIKFVFFSIHLPHNLSHDAEPRRKSRLFIIHKVVCLVRTGANFMGCGISSRGRRDETRRLRKRLWRRLAQRKKFV